uniref:Uncharacterized protein n=1 Tax=Megaselia scalaris TaxID=36166 RepID=T1GA46_MEGSC
MFGLFPKAPYTFLPKDDSSSYLDTYVIVRSNFGAQIYEILHDLDVLMAHGDVKRNGFRSSKVITTTTTSTSSSISEDAHTKRMKFKVNQMSRDVPVGQPDTHQTVNLEEAANATKDCLLHLLDKYNERKTRNPLGRHQSFSVDWNTSNNLQYRSMSSINAFFQRQNVGAGGRNIRSLQAQLMGGKPQEDQPGSN